MKYRISVAALAIGSSLLLTTFAKAESLATYQLLTPETALELAQATMKACRSKDYQVSVAVVDRMGGTQVILRDRFAGPHTPETARSKAWTSVSFRSDTLSMSDVTRMGGPQAGAQFIPGTVMIGGGVPVEAGGFIVAGVGVSGSPGGKDDDACSRVGIDAIREKLEF